MLAGKFFMLSGQYPKALALLLRCPVTESGESIDLAIETVHKFTCCVAYSVWRQC